MAKPVTHRANREVQTALEGWRQRTRHLRIWAYTVTFGWRANNLPLPNLRVIAEDLRYYRELGVEGLFVQHDHPLLADMRDLKLWTLFKLVEDPTREVDALVLEFTEGFYGAAGSSVREYLAELERAARRRPATIRYPVTYKQYRYLTPKFLRRAQTLFDRAAEQADGDAILLRRLRHARLSLDRATLLRWDDALAAPTRRGNGRPIDPERVAARYRRTAAEQIELRIRPSARSEKLEAVEREIDKLMKRVKLHKR